VFAQWIKRRIHFRSQRKNHYLGFFFDTYKEDNKGQVVLEINTVSATEVTEEYETLPELILPLAPGGNETQETQERPIPVGTGGNVNESNVTVVGIGGGTSTGGTGSAISSGGGSFSGGGASFRGENDFRFSFDQDQMERMWQEMAARLESSVSITDQKDENKQAYWESLEKSILKGYQSSS
jgi:hypothetical protein